MTGIEKSNTTKLGGKAGLEILRETQGCTQEYSMEILNRPDIPAYYPNGQKANFLESTKIIQYPPQILRVLGKLYQEYNTQFSKLVLAKEGGSDYMLSGENCFIQIDMVALPDNFLSLVGEGYFSDKDLIDILRKSIFEMENSLAAYSLLRQLGEGESGFRGVMDNTIGEISDIFSARVVVATLTDEKYAGVRSFDAGIAPGLGGDVAQGIKENTGFDDVLSPRELSENYQRGSSDIRFYTRASLDRKGLVNPQAQDARIGLGNINFREYLRENSLTYNIDLPDDFENTLNDTKEYMPDMGMGVIISDMSDILSEEYQGYLSRNKPQEKFSGDFLAENIREFLQQQGVAQELIDLGEVELQCKPLLATYGGYGQISGSILEGKMRTKLAKEMRKRGSYIIQPRMPRTSVLDSNSGRKYICIDRIFFAKSPFANTVSFMGGFRNYVPEDSNDGKKGIVHGSVETVYGIIK